MHKHPCRYCENFFICPVELTSCYRRFIVCDDCFWKYQSGHYALVFLLAAVAVGLTFILIRGEI